MKFALCIGMSIHNTMGSHFLKSYLVFAIQWWFQQFPGGHFILLSKTYSVWLLFHYCSPGVLWAAVYFVKYQAFKILKYSSLRTLTFHSKLYIPSCLKMMHWIVLVLAYFDLKKTEIDNYSLEHSIILYVYLCRSLQK